ncbi:serine/threonine-protein kinase PCRK1-like [Vigna umbellata]|uniref:serine/threonine-protein kinase PCRK1-like n=1 Tax=Vigna umbellata TaxID=87088 RepID=UPI001F5E8486|nr:serine/threonine-protein kinase PCRK1-like [Vigna umbellata]
MGCFTVLKYKKEKINKIRYTKCVSHIEHVPTVLPEPQIHTRSLHSAPSSFRNRVKSTHPINKVTNPRTRTLSAPSALDVATQNTLTTVEFEDQEESRYNVGSLKGQHSSNPLPLPLPSHQGGGELKATGSFKSGIVSGSVYGPDVAEQDALASVEYEEQEESKHRVGLVKDHCSTNSQPLPLPSRQGGGAALKAKISTKLGMATAPAYVCGPLPLPPTGLLRNLPFEEISAACHNFSSDRCMSECLSSTIYSASFGDDASSAKKFEATVTRLHSSTHGLKEFINDVNTLASLQHPNLCKLLGFHARDGSEPRMLVYERLYHGSLDQQLFGRSDGHSIDWNSRMKVAICAAQGLTFLHEEGPFQAMYNEFSAANIQIDKDFSAKLSGYGCVGRIPEEEISSSTCAVGNLSVETLERGILTPKSYVWGFGIILLELLTGRKNVDSHHPKEERNLVKWSRPFLADDFRLSLIMDPQLKGRYPPKAARAVADIAQRCLQKEPSERPPMRTIVEHLKVVQDMKYSCWFPLQEPAKQMSRSPSLNGVKCLTPTLSFSPSTAPVTRPSVSSPRWCAVPTLHLPLGACSSTFSMDDHVRPESRKSILNV